MSWPRMRCLCSQTRVFRNLVSHEIWNWVLPEVTPENISQVIVIMWLFLLEKTKTSPTLIFVQKRFEQEPLVHEHLWRTVCQPG